MKEKGENKYRCFALKKNYHAPIFCSAQLMGTVHNTAGTQNTSSKVTFYTE